MNKRSYNDESKKNIVEFNKYYEIIKAEERDAKIQAFFIKAQNCEDIYEKRNLIKLSLNALLDLYTIVEYQVVCSEHLMECFKSQHNIIKKLHFKHIYKFHQANFLAIKKLKQLLSATLKDLEYQIEILMQKEK